MSSNWDFWNRVKKEVRHARAQNADAAWTPPRSWEKRKQQLRHAADGTLLRVPGSAAAKTVKPFRGPVTWPRPRFTWPRPRQ